MSDDGPRLPLGIEDLPSHSLFSAAPSGPLFHYTTAGGAAGIIASKSIWMTKIQHLNDSQELKYFIDLFKLRIDHSDDPEIVQHQSILKSLADQLSSFERTNICVASFCEDRDLLSQWRGYGEYGSAIALGFDPDALTKLTTTNKLRLWRCVYSASDQRRLIDELARNIIATYKICTSSKTKDPAQHFKEEVVPWINTVILRVAPAFKHPGFAEEREWRLVSMPIKSTDKDYKVRVVGNRLIPYYDCSFDTPNGTAVTGFPEIILGPSPNQRQVEDGLHALLRKAHFDWSTIRYSRIPFRQF